MQLIHAIILGIIEGTTEFLPISSTGHLILVSDVLNLANTEFLKTFQVAIQLGAILAIVYLYTPQVKWNMSLGKKLILAFLPSAVFGFLLYDFIKSVLFQPLVVVISLIVGGVILIVIDRMFGMTQTPKVNPVESISYRQALAIGLFQIFSMIPGVSRAGATIVGGISQGLSKRQATEFSFLLAIPTMLAASSYDLYKTADRFSAFDYLLLAVSFIGAFVSAIVAVKLLLKVVNRHGFTWFGYYRIGLGLLYGWLFL